ncbi:hypothetical protein CY658_02970 [Variovorax sp. RO1]|nr:hypothetical protein CY658_02970 [Variovorax sp. RO1]
MPNGEAEQRGSRIGVIKVVLQNPSMEMLLNLLFRCPKCWQKVGYVLFAFSGAMLLLGLRLSRRAGRVESRTGITLNLDQLLADVPLPIPVNGEGFALASLGVAVGLALAIAGKWAGRF